MTHPKGNPPHSSGQALLCGWWPIVTSFCALKDARRSFYVLKNMNSFKNVDKSNVSKRLFFTSISLLLSHI